jgi:hypothetical protein
LKDGLNYLVTEVGWEHIDADLINYLCKQAANPAFSDLADAFVDNENLYVAFVMHRGVSLDILLENEYTSPQERAELLKRVIERVVLQDMPAFFAAECLTPENIYVTRELDISFKYKLDNVYAYTSRDIDDVQDILSKTISLLFQEELSKEVAPPIKKLAKALKDHKFASYLDVFAAVNSAINEFFSSGEDFKMPKTLPFRLWDTLKKGFRPLKAIVMILVVLAVLAYLVYTVMGTMAEPEPASALTHIGTLELR